MKLFVVDVTLDGTSTQRRLRVPAELTLDDLHAVVQATLGWDESYPHRFRGRAVGLDEHTTLLPTVFTAPDVSIGYVYDERYAVTITSVAAELKEDDTADFACLSGDPSCDVEAVSARLRRAFITIVYHADRAPAFTAWRDRDAVVLFEEAVSAFLSRREPEQNPVVLRERARLQSSLEELLATPSMTILRDSTERLQAEGLSRGETLDGLVALAASFPGDVSDPREQVAFLTSARDLSAAAVKGTFPHGPAPVIATQLALKATRERNRRRRKR